MCLRDSASARNYGKLAETVSRGLCVIRRSIERLSMHPSGARIREKSSAAQVSKSAAFRFSDGLFQRCELHFKETMSRNTL